MTLYSTASPIWPSGDDCPPKLQRGPERWCDQRLWIAGETYVIKRARAGSSSDTWFVVFGQPTTYRGTR
jgi:hypothetical protein